jgi:predicted enzyme related to lactoylglutathione lyase
VAVTETHLFRAMILGAGGGRNRQGMTRARANPVVHLELHTGDLRGARDFYARLCGWQAERVVAGSGSYLAVELGNGFGGGIVECETRKPIWLPYVEVEEISATTERARELGASVLLEPREGPAGWRSTVAAPDGGEIAFWQPKRAHRL